MKRCCFFNIQHKKEELQACFHTALISSLWRPPSLGNLTSSFIMDCPHCHCLSVPNSGGEVKKLVSLWFFKGNDIETCQSREAFYSLGIILDIRLWGDVMFTMPDQIWAQRTEGKHQTLHSGAVDCNFRFSRAIPPRFHKTETRPQVKSETFERKQQ